MNEIYDRIHRMYPNIISSIQVGDSQILFFDFEGNPKIDVKIKSNGFQTWVEIFDYKNKLTP